MKSNLMSVSVGIPTGEPFEDLAKNGSKRGILLNILPQIEFVDSCPINSQLFLILNPLLTSIKILCCVLFILFVAQNLMWEEAKREGHNPNSDLNLTPIQWIITIIIIIISMIITLIIVYFVLRNKIQEVVDRRAAQTSETSSILTESSDEESKEPLIRPEISGHILASIVINNATLHKVQGQTKSIYVKLFINNHFIGVTPVQNENQGPVWDYLIADRTTLTIDSVLLFEIYDRDNNEFSNDLYLGAHYLKVKDLLSKGLNGKRIDMDYVTGVVMVTITWQ